MPSPSCAISWSSDRALRVLVGDGAPSEAALDVVHAAYRSLVAADLSGVADITPAYATITLTLDARRLPDDAALATLEHRVRAVLAALLHPDPAGPTPTPASVRLVDVPVCYDAEFAPDLADVAAQHALAPQRVIALHASADYRVAFMGFSPGFGYLSGLPGALHTPRLPSPRTRVPAGSVAIGGAQTGVYPLSTPGGWRIIGRTPLTLFDAARPEPALLRTGDRVRFVPIDRARFDVLHAAHARADDGIAREASSP